MAHIHIVDDYDRRFVIDPITRKLTNQTPEKNTLVQNDHNSERFTFELPRIIEGHDMCTCNSVQVHYINIDSTTKAQSVGVYPVDDLRVDPENDNVVLCSWLVSQNATKHKGLLSFVVRFVCTTEGNIDYAWNTAVCSDVTISDGIYNSDVVMEEYADVLSEFEARITALEQAVVGIPEIHVMRFDNGDESGVTIFVEKTNADGDIIDETATVYDGKGGGIHVGPEPPDNPNVDIWIDTSEDAQKESYELPAATAETLGGVKAEPATEDDTQPVRIGADGMLFTVPGGGGEKWETIVDYTVPEDCAEVFLKTDINGNPFKLKRAIVTFLLFPAAGLTSDPWPVYTVDGTVDNVYYNNHYRYGAGYIPYETGMYRLTKFEVVQMPDGVHLLTVRETKTPAAYDEDGDVNASSVMGGGGFNERFHAKNLAPVVTEISAVGIGYYMTAIGAGTRIIMQGVRE